MGALWQVASKSNRRFWKLIQRCQRIAQHCPKIKVSFWLIQSPKRFCVIGVQLKQLLQEPLRYFQRR